MTQDNRGQEQDEREFEADWEQGGAGRPVALQGIEDWYDDGPESLLSELSQGQSLTIHWGEPEPYVTFESFVSCRGCGGALTEARLAIFGATESCPSCGRPPSA